MRTCPSTTRAGATSLVRTQTPRVGRCSLLCRPTAASDDIDFRCVFLTYKRKELYQKLDWRCEKILQRGMLDEVQQLLHSRRLPPGSGPALAVGYRQAIAFLTCKEERWANAPGEGARNAFNIDRFWLFLDQFQVRTRRRRRLMSSASANVQQAATRRLARKQLTWFRRESLFRFIEVNDADDAEKTLTEMKTFFEFSPQELSEFLSAPTYIAQQQSLKNVMSKEDANRQRQYRATL